MLKEHIRPGKVSLDLMCGFAPFIPHLEGEVIGLDIGRRELSKAPPGLNLVQGDARQLPLAPNSFDIVFCMGFSFMNSPPEVLEGKIFPEVWRVLKPHGKFIFSTLKRIGRQEDYPLKIPKIIKRVLMLRDPLDHSGYGKDGKLVYFLRQYSLKEYRRLLQGWEIIDVDNGRGFFTLVCEKNPYRKI